MINTELLSRPIQKITLARDVTKHLKRGHRWIFADCFKDSSQTNSKEDKIRSGLGELIFKGQTMAYGIVQADTQLRFRVLFLADDFYFKKGSIPQSFKKYAEIEFQKALNLRSNFYKEGFQTSFRLLNGEGDGFPGLVIDIYDDTAVIKHDHPIMFEIWDRAEIAKIITASLPYIKTVYHKRRNDDDNKGEELIGKLKEEVIFFENGLKFTSNIRDAAKTGFFLDQRDNRKLLSQFTQNKSLLNLFSYTGGFSVFAANGGASSVTSVDIAKKAIEACERNFEVNNFKTPHEALALDAFAYIDEAIKAKKKFDVVVTDPPSFAPNQKSVQNATEAYTKVYSDSIKLVNNQGIFVASSCSSHITHQLFLDICRESFSRARKRGTLIYCGGQPFDHPFPLIMEELRYLKFAIFRVD